MKLFFLIILIILDFLSKRIVFHFIELHKVFSIAPFIDITHIHNYGILFGLFAGVMPFWFIVFLGLLMVIFLIFWMLNLAIIPPAILTLKSTTRSSQFINHLNQ